MKKKKKETRHTKAKLKKNQFRFVLESCTKVTVDCHFLRKHHKKQNTTWITFTYHINHGIIINERDGYTYMCTKRHGWRCILIYSGRLIDFGLFKWFIFRCYAYVDLMMMKKTSQNSPSMQIFMHRLKYESAWNRIWFDKIKHLNQIAVSVYDCMHARAAISIR